MLCVGRDEADGGEMLTRKAVSRRVARYRAAQQAAIESL